MIICLQTRMGEIHYVWLTDRGFYHTMCGKTFQRKNRLNTYGVYDSIPDACPNCRAAIVSLTDDDSGHRVRDIDGNLTGKSISKYQGIQMEIGTTKDIYSDVLDYRYWPKLRRMKGNRKSPIYDK